jgi:hypothetical protein
LKFIKLLQELRILKSLFIFFLFILKKKKREKYLFHFLKIEVRASSFSTLETVVELATEELELEEF